YAYYNYSHGPYANWKAGGGFATYAGGCQNCAGGYPGVTGNVWNGYSVQYRYQPLPGYPTYGYPYDYPGMPVAPSLLSDAGRQAEQVGDRDGEPRQDRFTSNPGAVLMPHQRQVV